MVAQDTLLVTLVKLVDMVPMPAPPPRGRGRPRYYPDRLFLKALVVMVVRHLAVAASAAWIPLAAALTRADTADNVEAPGLLAELPESVRFVLGDSHYNTPELHDRCAVSGRQLVASSRKPRYPHSDDGVEV